MVWYDDKEVGHASAGKEEEEEEEAAGETQTINRQQQVDKERQGKDADDPLDVDVWAFLGQGHAKDTASKG